MPRIGDTFVVKKVTITPPAPGGGQGVTFDTGSDIQDDAFSIESTFLTGSDNSKDKFTFTPVLAQGVDAASDRIVPSLVSSHNIGTDTANQAFSVSQTQQMGSDTASNFTTSVTANLSDFTDTATNTRDTGSTDWVNPTNAQGAFNATMSTFSLAAGVALTTGGATLKCSGLNLPATPSGFTLSSVSLQIRQQWDVELATPLVDTATITAQLRTGNGLTVLGTVFQRTDDGGAIGGIDGLTRAALATDSLNIDSIRGANTSFQVWCSTSVNLTLATSGNMSWGIDGVHLVCTFIRSGIQ